MPTVLPRPQEGFVATLMQPLNEYTADMKIKVSPLPTEKPGYLIINPSSDVAREKLYYADVDTGTNEVTGVVRGITFSNTPGVQVVRTMLAANLRKHSVGETVEMDNGMYEMLMADRLNGLDDEYVPTEDYQLATVKVVNDTAFAGAPDASETVKGISEIPTTTEIDDDEEFGTTGARLAINPKNLATSKYGVRLPTVDEQAAMDGTSGTPSATNKFVTDEDTTTTSIASKLLRLTSEGKIDSIFFQSIEAFTSSGTWTKPKNARAVMVIAVGAGGGGGGGLNGNSGGNYYSGGSGGGAGYKVTKMFDADDLTATVAVGVGSGGNGGTGGLLPTAGVSGGNSTFGSYLTAYGGGGGFKGAASGSSLVTSGGGGGGSAGAGAVGNSIAVLGGSPASVAGADGISGQGAGGKVVGAAGSNAEYGGGSGGSSTSSDGGDGGSSIYAAGGGGGGGGTASTGPAGDGGDGGGINKYTVAGGGAGGAKSETTANATNGTAGTDGNMSKCGTGGGGGGSINFNSDSVYSAGNGGAGGAVGGGGGGGGAARRVEHVAGNGGAGGAGAVYVVTV